jgi:hypothetical protein
MLLDGNSRCTSFLGLTPCPRETMKLVDVVAPRSKAGSGLLVQAFAVNADVLPHVGAFACPLLFFRRARLRRIDLRHSGTTAIDVIRRSTVDVEFLWIVPSLTELTFSPIRVATGIQGSLALVQESMVSTVVTNNEIAISVVAADTVYVVYVSCSTEQTPHCPFDYENMLEDVTIRAGSMMVRLANPDIPFVKRHGLGSLGCQ